MGERDFFSWDGGGTLPQIVINLPGPIRSYPLKENHIKFMFFVLLIDIIGPVFIRNSITRLISSIKAKL